MQHVTSRDGTTIAFDRDGEGPAIITVVGAFNDRSTAAPLTRAMQENFTVYTYDRRGRGDSGDTAPYAVDREVDDLQAILTEAGGSAAIFGFSSGAVLALHAIAHGLAITRLALYEPPFVIGDSRPPAPPDVAGQLSKLIAQGRRGDAVEFWQTQVVGMPEEMVVQMRQAPFRPGLEAMVHTLVYEARIMGDYNTIPAELVASANVPTLVLNGDQSPPFLHDAAQAIANTLPNGRLRTLAGQTHDLVPEALAPVLTEFFQKTQSFR